MGEPGLLGEERRAALLLLLFLHRDSEDLNYGRELSSRAGDLLSSRDINHNGPGKDAEEHGLLESDGLPPGDTNGCLADLLPLVELDWPGGQQEVFDAQAVAAELREIAAQLELELMSRAVHSLSRNLSESPSNARNHLVNEVERLMRQVSLKDLPRERVLVALTLTLVKGVCVQAPRLLRSLFDTAVQFICQRRDG